MFRRSAVVMWVALVAAISACDGKTDHAANVAAASRGPDPARPAAADAGAATADSRESFPASATSTDSEQAAETSTSTSASTIAAKGDPLQGFTLTMARVDAYMSAIRNISMLAQQDPSLESITAMDASNENAAQYSARIDQHPEVVAAISDAGLSPREFALTGEALVTGMMTQSALESGALKQIPAGVNPQLVDFVRHNKSALNAKWKSPRMP